VTVKLSCTVCNGLKPNSITLAGSELVGSWFEAGSKPVADQLRTSWRNGISLLRLSSAALLYEKIDLKNAIYMNVTQGHLNGAISAVYVLFSGDYLQ